MDSHEEQPYLVRANSDRYEVINSTERVVVVCRDQAGAQDYAVLLNEAYRSGFKAGYRAGKTVPNRDG